MRPSLCYRPQNGHDSRGKNLTQSLDWSFCQQVLREGSWSAQRLICSYNHNVMSCFSFVRAVCVPCPLVCYESHCFTCESHCDTPKKGELEQAVGHIRMSCCSWEPRRVVHRHHRDTYSHVIRCLCSSISASNLGGWLMDLLSLLFKYVWIHIQCQ